MLRLVLLLTVVSAQYVNRVEQTVESVNYDTGDTESPYDPSGPESTVQDTNTSVNVSDTSEDSQTVLGPNLNTTDDSVSSATPLIDENHSTTTQTLNQNNTGTQQGKKPSDFDRILIGSILSSVLILGTIATPPEKEYELVT